MGKNKTNMIKNYRINDAKCKKCGICRKNCPAEAIEGKIKESFLIDKMKCIKCGICINKCKFNAIDEAYILENEILKCTMCGKGMDSAVNFYMSTKINIEPLSYKLCIDCRKHEFAKKMLSLQCENL